MLELIPKKEREAMLSYMKDYGDARDPDFEKIFSVWEENKQWLFQNIFKDRLIVSKEIDFTLNYDQSLDLFRDMSEKDDSIQRFLSLLAGKIDDYENYRMLISTQNLVTNVYLGRSFTIITPGKPIKIQNGTKVMPILRKLSEIYGLEDEYEKARILHSIFMERRKAKGTLCLSIHPFDFMSMSDNDCGWDSCMSWREGGDYRLGTTEMMNSPYMVIAYISQDNNFEGHFANKSWRQMFIVNDRVIIEGRPYPFRQEQITLQIFDWIKELLGTTGWDEEPFSIKNDTPFCKSPVKKLFSRINIKTKYMYNDYKSTLKSFLVLLNNEKFDFESIYEINISGPAQCMNCGGIHADFRNNSVICDFCIPTFVCDLCEEDCPVEDRFSIVMYDGGPACVCPECFENNIWSCDRCHLSCDKEDIFILRTEVPNSSIILESYLCPDCYNEAAVEGIIVKDWTYPQKHTTKVSYPKLTKEQLLRYFGYEEK